MAAMESGKKYDLVVFGATGFTGQFVVEEIARTRNEVAGLTWAVAGRSMTRLQNVLRKVSKLTGKNVSETPIIIADVSSQSTLKDMCAQAKVILNCVGPYQLYGEPVIRACIENKTHHVDISGEPVFLEEVQLSFNSKAKDAGIYILQSCGFDSIPAEMGLIYTKKQFEGDLNHVETYLYMLFGTEGFSGNSGTWISAVHGYANANKLRTIRKQLFKEPLPRSQFNIPKRYPVFYNDDVSGWCMPFIGADRSIVMRSQRYNYEHHKERPVQLSTYLKVPSLMVVWYFMLIGLIFALLSRFSIGRKIMIKFPKITSLGMFSSGGPSRKQIESSSFMMHFVCEGHEKKLEGASEQHTDEPNKKFHTRVIGPEAGYLTTSIAMVQSAYVLLQEADKLPPGGGVFTPGAAFGHTSLMERLSKHHFKFEIIK